jgi:ubiquinone/menaquinone biosynthesis C-methylase UbiE
MSEFRPHLIDGYHPGDADFTSIDTKVTTPILRTDRSFEAYQGFFFIKPEMTRDKVVVDLGAGPEQNFAKGLQSRQETYRAKQIISIDPFATEKHSSGIVAGEAEHLPLKDESVGALFASNSIPMYLRNQAEIEAAFSEIARVLEKNGDAYIFPLCYLPEDPTIEDNMPKFVQYYDAPEFFDQIIERLKGEHPDLVINLKENIMYPVESLADKDKEINPVILNIHKSE